MVKYKDYGRKILAVLLAIATVLTTSSIDLRALAAPEPTSTTIYSGGYLGEIYTNNSSNQKVNSVSFDMIQVAGIPYDYTAYIYENPTVDGDPQSGVIRKVVEKSIDTSAETVRSTIDIPIGNGSDGKPIVLTNGEKLGVAIMLSGDVGDNPIQYYETGAPETGNGYRKDTGTSGWVKRGDIVTVSTENAGEPYDLTDITMNPTTTFLTVGDDDVALNTTFTPNYKRTIAYESSNESIIKRDGQKVHAVGSGQASLTASYGGVSDTKNFTVFQNTVGSGTWTYTYTGSEIKPTVEVWCGSKLTENTDYELKYSNCIYPGTASVTIKGLNQYAGYSKTYNYTIDKATLTQEMVNSTKDGGTATYTIDTSTGEVKSATIENLTKDTDFTAVATYVSSAVGKVTYNVIVTGKGNYVGGPFTTSVDVPADPSATIDINAVVDAVLTDDAGNVTDEFTYTGSDISPKVKFYLKDTSTVVNFADNVEIGPIEGSDASDESKTLTITGKTTAGYSGTITLDYWVVPLDIEDAKISVEVQEETPGSGKTWTHTGNQIKPKVTVKYTNGKTSTLTLGKDYEVDYDPNINVGNGRIYISGIGNFTGTRTEDFEIIADFVKDASLKLGGFTANYSNNFITGYSVPYRGTPYTTRISNFTLAGKSAKEGTDYTTQYIYNTDAGTAEIKVTGQGKYAGPGNEFTVKFTITPKTLTSGLTVIQQPHTYTGNVVELKDGEYWVYDGSKLLTKGTDYDVSFANNINAGAASVNVTGKGNYGGMLLGTYTIDPLSISDGNVTIEPIDDRTYTGAAQEPPVVVKLNGVVVPSSNYTVSYSNNINVGTANVTLTGKGNFTGSRNDVTFKINPKTLAGLEYTIGGVPCTKVSETGTSYTSEYVADYTGLEVKPAVVVYDGGNVLTSNDYTVSYSGNINVGTARARVAGRGSYAGSVVYITFNIDYKSIENTVVTPTGTRKDGSIIYPTVTVYDPTAPYGARDLKEGTHYDVIATATHAGAGNTATIKGKGNYVGEKQITYNIGEDLSGNKINIQLWSPDGTAKQYEPDPSGAISFEYIGNQEPNVKIFNGSNIIAVENYDLTWEVISGSGQYNAGSKVRVTATGKGDNYYNSKSIEYTIKKKSLADNTTMTLTDISNNNTKTANWTYTYDRLTKAVVPKIVYNVDGGNAITLANTDYTLDQTAVGPNVVYDSSGNVTSIPVTISAADNGNYSGSVTVNYVINPCPVSSDKISIADIGDQPYEGPDKAVRPLPVLTHTLSDASTRDLVFGTDYDLSYDNNTSIGKTTDPNPPTVVITGKGNYSGTANKKFNIVQRELKQDNTTITGVVSKEYNGNPQTQNMDEVSVWYNGNVLTSNDFDVSYTNNTKIGVGNIDTKQGPIMVIKGKGAYTGTVYCPFTIQGNIDSDIFIIDGLQPEYPIINGDINITKDDIRVKYKDPTSASGAYIYVDPSYYELEKPSTILPGERQLRIKGNGSVMYGTATQNIKLTGSFNDVTISGILPVYDYTGSSITPSPTVKYGTRVLTQDVDYTLSYNKNTDAGTASITITPKEGRYYTDSASTTFKIQYNLEEAEISGYDKIYGYDYTGSQITPNPITVEVHGKKLSSTNDYTLTYGNNKNVSEGGQIIITAKEGENATAHGTQEATFRINPVTITDFNAVFDPWTYPYTGQSQRPVPNVTKGTKTLTEGVDFRVEYPTDTVNVGFKPVNIVGMGNYTGKITGDTTTGPYYHIGQVSITGSAVTIEVGDAYYAGGENVTPPYSVKYNGIPLVKDRDYTVSMSGTHAIVGTGYSITFTGINNFYGEVEKTYAIKQADLSKGVVKLSETSSEYTGSPIVPRIVATIDKGDGTPYYLKEGEDKDYVVTFNGGQAMIGVGTYSILVEGRNNFINSLSETYTVTAKDLSDSSKVVITYDIDNDYTGAEVRPAPKVWDIARGVPLVEGTDYAVYYANNVAAASKDSALPPTITVVGQGNYTGTFSGTFNIGHPLGSLEIVLDSYQYTYDGQLHVPGVQVKRGNIVLVEGVDYEKSYSNFDGSALDANAGKKSVNIIGYGGYYSDSSRTYDIVAKVANANMIKIVPSLPKDESGNYYTVYTGTDIEPVVTIYDEEISSAIPVDPSNYDVAYVRNKDMSTPTNPALIKIVFKNNYAMGAESYTMPFYIKAKTIETGFEAYLPGGSQYAYTGNEVEPEVIVKPTSLDTVEGELIEGVDYTLTYINNVNAGTASVVVTGINNYSGEVVLPYNVVANLNDSTIIAPDQFYTGSEVHAPLTITCGGNTLVEGIDYAVTYTSDDNWQTRGTATVTSLQPYYAGTVTKDYNILFDPTILKVVGYANEYAFTGGPIKPDFKIVTPDGQEIPYNPEDITYYNSSTGFGDCTSIGTVTATIPLNIGDKACELKAVYDIIGRNINLCNIVPLYDNVYTGNKLYPPVIIRNEQGDLLTEGVDYTLEYSNNIYPGVGKIVITGKGNYIASVTKYFNIIAPNMLGLTAAPEGDNAVKLSWLRNARITGYEIYSGDCSVKYGSTSDTTFTVTGLKQATDYEFKVRTYITANGRTSYGEFKSVTGHSGMGKPEITVQSLARQRATINWTSAGNVSGYEIYRGSSATGTFSKIAVMPSSAGGYSDSNLVSGGTYYYKVRAYDKVGDNQFVYGYFSDPKAVTIR
jgi:hypothetical protein